MEKYYITILNGVQYIVLVTKGPKGPKGLRGTGFKLTWSFSFLLVQDRVSYI